MSISWENDVNETLEFTANPIINNKIKAVVVGLPKSIANLFLEFPNDHNKDLVADFLQACIKQENIAINTKRVLLLLRLVVGLYSSAASPAAATTTTLLLPLLLLAVHRRRL
jgi:hypothetical protein